MQNASLSAGLSSALTFEASHLFAVLRQGRVYREESAHLLDYQSESSAWPK